jgi:hypothetical protein
MKLEEQLLILRIELTKKQIESYNQVDPSMN